MSDSFSYQLMPFFGVLLVIFLAYAGTKFISKRYAKMSSGKNVKVMERINLGQEKSLVLITINKKAYLLGVTGKDMSIVCELDESELATVPEENKADFLSLITDGLKKSGNGFKLPTEGFKMPGGDLKNFPNNLKNQSFLDISSIKNMVKNKNKYGK